MLLRRSGSALVIELVLGLGRSRLPLRLLFDTGSVRSWGCVRRTFMCARASDDLTIAYEDGSGVRVQACAVALTIGDRLFRNAPFGAVRDCTKLGVFGFAPAAGGMHELLEVPAALCALPVRSESGARDFTFTVGVASCACLRGRTQVLPTLGRHHWKVELFGVRLELWTASMFGKARTDNGAHTLNESAIVGPLFRTMISLEHSSNPVLIDTGATHVFMPLGAVLAVGLHVLAAEARLIFDLGGPASGSPIRSYAVPLTSRRFEAQLGLTPSAQGRTSGQRGDALAKASPAWRTKLESMAAILAVHPRARLQHFDAGEQWVLGMPFLDALDGGIAFAADASKVELFAGCG